jgi:hypothetical protein
MVCFHCCCCLGLGHLLQQLAVAAACRNQPRGCRRCFHQWLCSEHMPALLCRLLTAAQCQTPGSPRRPAACWAAGTPAGCPATAGNGCLSHDAGRLHRYSTDQPAYNCSTHQAGRQQAPSGCRSVGAVPTILSAPVVAGLASAGWECLSACVGRRCTHSQQHQDTYAYYCRVLA